MNKSSKGKRIVWICPYCLWICVSAQKHHQMDVCPCGKTGLDYELEYTRIMGNLFPLLEIDLDTRVITKKYPGTKVLSFKEY